MLLSMFSYNYSEVWPKNYPFPLGASSSHHEQELGPQGNLSNLMVIFFYQSSFSIVLEIKLGVFVPGYTPAPQTFYFF